jgi:type I restriction enzyme S subunit
MVTVPSIDKQREIIELEKQLVEKEIEADSLFADQLTQLENLNQAILQEAVQGKLVPQDPNDEPASELLKRIKAEKAKSGKKEKPLPPIKPEEIPFEIPSNWVWCRLGEIISISSGDGLTSFQMDKAGKIPVYGGNGINGFHSKFNIDSKKIVIGRVGAYCGAVHITENKAWVTDNAFVVSFSESNIDFNWLTHFLRALDLNKMSYKGNQPVISGARVYPLLVALPPLTEQKRIVAEIEKQLAKTKQLKEHIIANQQATEQLLKALLHQAFEVEEMEAVNS